MQIKHLNIELTNKCNQRCVYCFNESGPKPMLRGIAFSDWKKFLELQIREGLQSVHLTGGEPFVDRNTMTLLAEAQRLGVRTSVLSNGFRIAELLPANPNQFKLLTVVQISLDAASAARHDARRGKRGAWREAIAALRALHRYSVPCEVSCTVSQENLEDIDRIARFCLRLGMKLIVRALVSFGRGSSSGLTSVPEGVLRSALQNIETRYPGVLTSDRFHYVPSSPSHDVDALTKGVLTILPNGQFRGGAIRVQSCSHFVESVQDLLAA